MCALLHKRGAYSYPTLRRVERLCIEQIEHETNIAVVCDYCISADVVFALVCAGLFVMVLLTSKAQLV